MTPFVLTIFGATGDLTQHKLIPALFSLYKQKLLPEDFYIIGFARRGLTDFDFSIIFEELKLEPEWIVFAKHLIYQQGDFNEQRGYEQLIQLLNTLDKKHGACIMRIFYLATPPQHYQTILGYLYNTKLSEGCGQGGNKWTRIAIEKPFGKDIETAKMLDTKLAEIFEEQQIFRVDHYLAKETVQNILTFRFANSIFEPVWNSGFIDHVQITWGEKKGVEGRESFFDGVGLLRDVAQNHLLQLLAAIAMEQPKSFTKEDVREARVSAIKAVAPVSEDDIVLGQYKGYRENTKTAEDTKTETFAALKLFVNTERFSNVPFYIRAGKKMTKDIVTISIVFKQTCHILFKDYSCPEIGNVLTFRIQPNEGIALRVITKKPGVKLSLSTVDLNFSYKEEFGMSGIDAYERLILDIFTGDQMLFNRSDELESSWELLGGILSKNNNLYLYQENSWGPEEANSLLEKDRRSWL